MAYIIHRKNVGPVIDALRIAADRYRAESTKYADSGSVIMAQTLAAQREKAEQLAAEIEGSYS